QGGQILRICASISAITHKPIRVGKIRAGRSNPGLSNQHLTGIQLVADMCNASLQNCHFGSTELTFIPGVISGGYFVANAKTAGSISLLAQIALPVALFAPCETRFVLEGGTDALFAPPIDYLTLVAKFYLEKMGANFTVKTIRRGFYPRGGGIVQLDIQSLEKPLKAITATDFGKVSRVTGYAFTAGNTPEKISHQIQKEATRLFKSSFNCPIDIGAYRESNETSHGNIATFQNR
ncbi:unnamed protein product, partial [Protopolystoma xenopodis]